MPALSLAPAEYRCARVLSSGEQCSRFRVRLEDGQRDEFCVGHSPTEHAAALRAKSMRSRREAALAERKHRQHLMQQLLPSFWAEPADFQVTRFALARLIVSGEISVAEARELRAILDGAEAHMKTPPNAWHPPTIE